MANNSVLGLFIDENDAGDALSALRKAKYQDNEFEIMTGAPYPHGTFGEAHPKIKLHRFPIFGAVIGFTVALIITIGTQLAYPLVTGGKPILSIPPMLVIFYEMTLLFAVIVTILGALFESRLPKIFMGAYDERIMTEGYIGVVVTVPKDRISKAEDILKKSGAESTKRGWEEQKEDGK